MISWERRERKRRTSGPKLVLATAVVKGRHGIILVTEPHAEMNAGFVVVYAPDHDGIVDWSDIEPVPAQGMTLMCNARWINWLRLLWIICILCFA